MAISDIRGFKYQCDECGSEHVQENADAHYWESVPPGWCKFRYCDNKDVPRDVSMLLCGKCRRGVSLPLPPDDEREESK